MHTEFDLQVPNSLHAINIFEDSVAVYAANLCGFHVFLKVTLNLCIQ